MEEDFFPYYINEKLPITINLLIIENHTTTIQIKKDAHLYDVTFSLPMFIIGKSFLDLKKHLTTNKQTNKQHITKRLKKP